MISHETQQALNRKVESWEYHDLKNQVDNLKRLNNDFQEKVSRLEGAKENLREVLSGLIDAFQDNQSETSNELSFALQNLRAYL